MRETGEMVQQAGASARERLIAAAAKRWNVPASECAAAMSKVTHKPTGRTFRYGELAVEAAAIKLDKEPAIKKPDQFKFIGRRLARLDVPLKINGSAKYGIDLDVPGMVHAAIIACPVFGGTVKSVDESAIAGRRGVMQVVKLKDAVAVVADRHWRAQTALDALPIEWEVGAAGSTDSAQFRKDYLDALDQKGADARHDGNVDAAMPTAAKVIEATYDVPIIAHAPMEPLNAIAHVQADRVDVWVGTQNADLALTFAAQASGVKPENVYIHNTFSGGGFGRRLRSRRGRPGGRGLQGGRQAGEADLDARRGNPPGPLPHPGRDPLQGGICGRRHADCARHAQFGRQLEPAGRAQRPRPADDARPDQHGLQAAELPRHLDPQEHARAARPVARAWPLPERVLHGELHRRDGARGGQGPGGAAARAARAPPRLPAGDRRAGREGRLGQADARGQRAAASPSTRATTRSSA